MVRAELVRVKNGEVVNPAKLRRSAQRKLGHTYSLVYLEPDSEDVRRQRESEGEGEGGSEKLSKFVVGHSPEYPRWQEIIGEASPKEAVLSGEIVIPCARVLAVYSRMVWDYVIVCALPHLRTSS